MQKITLTFSKYQFKFKNGYLIDLGGCEIIRTAPAKYYCSN